MEKVKDTIYRQDAIDIIEDFPHGDVWNVESMEEMVYRIKQLPSAPERKTGKWIMKYKGSAVTSYKCSECGRTVKDDTGYDVSKDYPFCHCGADMR